jgi:hypothetical protein
MIACEEEKEEDSGAGVDREQKKSIGKQLL